MCEPQHGTSTNATRTHRLDWTPSFCCCLIPMRIIAGVMQNRDAHSPVLVHCNIIDDRQATVRSCSESVGPSTKRMHPDTTHHSDATCLR